MDDISSAIRSVLNDPQSMAQIQSIMQSLGGDSAAQNPPPAAPARPLPPKAARETPMQSLLPALGGGSDSPMISMLLRAAPLIASANQEDDATRLLAALRPLLGEERRKPRCGEPHPKAPAPAAAAQGKRRSAKHPVRKGGGEPMPNNMPDARAINEALRRAREMQSRAEPAAQAPPAQEAAPEPEPAQARQSARTLPRPHPGGGALAARPALKDKERTLILALHSAFRRGRQHRAAFSR